MAQYDLSMQMMKYLDPHLSILMLEHLEAHKVYPEAGLNKAKIQLLHKTNMVDTEIAAHEAVYGEGQAPQALAERRAAIIEQLRALQKEVKPFLDIRDNPELQEKIPQLREDELKTFKEENEITEELLTSVFKFAKMQYECGDYQTAADLLYYYRTLSTARTHDTHAMWGKVAAEICVMQNWTSALQDLRVLKEQLDASLSPQLEKRAWLIHWGMFVFFNHAEGRDLIIDWILADSKYLNIVQAACPHLLRYVAAACILNRKKRPAVIKEQLTRVVEQEHTSTDPVVQFIYSLFSLVDFDLAEQHLRECQAAIKSDFFLSANTEEFQESARLLIFEQYCRIHSVIDITMVAAKLDMDCEKAEAWLVNLIRQARLDAHIDAQKNQVIMDVAGAEVPQRIFDRTTQLVGRTQHLVKELHQKRLVV
eukprot:NODE_1281_length_1397_cov_16.858268_g1270_i0.p1 GENE.NODE_1281_length_1397_cov_16.858268_g1270_i0~~NODE_1281_length_1397_cov_16.858268_g1270_i0.p1  ORF type:complete len:423 (+),score=139.21 NODE_1281_length_1397_cov_16.858268_g1270_i0:69-1337(+)